MLPYPTSPVVNLLLQVLGQGSVTIAADELDELGSLLALLEVDMGRAAGVKRKTATYDLEKPAIVLEISTSDEKKLYTNYPLPSSPSSTSVNVQTAHEIKSEENAPSKVLPKSSFKRKATIGDLEVPTIVSGNSTSDGKKLCTNYHPPSSPSSTSSTVKTAHKIKSEESAPSKVLPKSSITCFFCDLIMPSGTDQNLYLQHLEVRFLLS